MPGTSGAAAASAAEPGESGGVPAMEPADPAGVAGAAPVVEGCTRSEFVLIGSVDNARDLGGLPVEGGASVACRSLFRGPPLYGLSSSGCADVEALGIRTVVDLRQDFERDSKPTSTCVNATSVLAPLPIPYEVSAENYLTVLSSPAVADVFHTFADPDAYPIYFHCTWGRDRTGVVGALLLLALGASRDDVMQEYMLSEGSVGAYPNSLSAVLDELEARGGAAAFLSEIGISEDQLAALRARGVAEP